MRKTGIVLIVLTAIVSAAAPAWAQYPPPPSPTCETNKSAAEPGEDVRVSGEDWQADSQVEIRFRQNNLSEEHGPFPTSPGGSFSATITIPIEAREGPARIVVGGPDASGRRTSCRLEITIRFEGQPPTPDATLCAIDDRTPAPGQRVKVSGRKWQPATNVEISFEQDAVERPLATARVNGSGRFAKQAEIPADADDGPADVVVRGADPEGEPATCRLRIEVTSSSASSAGFRLTPTASPATIGMLLLTVGAIALGRRRRTRALLAKS